MYIQNYRLGNTWLDKCLTSPASEDSSKGNVVNGSKHSWNLNVSNFNIFINHSEGN